MSQSTHGEQRLDLPDQAPLDGVQIGLRYDPRPPHQTALHNALAAHRNVVAVFHRRAGKTTAAAAVALMACLAAPGIRGAIILSTKTQGKLIYWQVLRELCADLPKSVVRFNDGEVSLTFANGSELLFLGHAEGEGDSVRGLKLAFAIVDECQQVASMATIQGAIMPALRDTPNSWFLAIGTPNEPSPLGELYEYASTSGDPLWAALHFPVTATGVFTDEEIAQLEREALNRFLWEQEWLCSLNAQDSNKLIDREALITAMRRPRPKEHWQRDPRYYDYPTVISVDLAGEGLNADAHAYAVRTGGLVHDVGVATPDEAANFHFFVARIMAQYRARGAGCMLLCDATGGYGARFMDRMLQLGFNVVPVNFAAASSQPQLHANKRAEMYERVARFVKRPDAILPHDRALLKELSSVTFAHDAKNRLVITPKAKLKAELGHSPDRADALAIGMLGDDMAQAPAAPRFAIRDRRPDGAVYQSDFHTPAHLRPNASRSHDPFGGSTFDPFQ